MTELTESPEAAPALTALMLADTPSRQAAAFSLLPVSDCVAALHAEELQLVERASARRQYGFASGRRVAREALAQLGQDEQVVIGRGALGEPLWPRGIIGSISHTGSLAVAIALVAEADKAGCWQSVGIDIERIRPLEAAVWQMIATPEEQQHPLAALDWYRMAVFSVKEALYKAMSLRCQRVVDFAEVSLEAFSPEELPPATVPVASSVPVYLQPEAVFRVASPGIALSGKRLKAELAGSVPVLYLYYWRGCVVSLAALLPPEG